MENVNNKEQATLYPQNSLKNSNDVSQDTSQKMSEALIKDQLKYCNTMIKSLKRHPDSGPFLHPVDPIALNVPDYLDVIKSPMDLSTVQNKLNENKYILTNEFINDIKLIFSNCYLYNGINSQISEMAKNLEKVFENMLKKMPKEGDIGSVGVKIKNESHPTTGSKKHSKRTPLKGEMKYCREALNEMLKKKYSGINIPFLQPVDPIALGVPDYYIVIKNPMDLSTLQKKLDNGEYENPKQFEDDCRLIFSNCYTYNHKDSNVYMMGKQLEEVFDNKWKNRPSAKGSIGSKSINMKSQQTSSTPVITPEVIKEKKEIKRHTTPQQQILQPQQSLPSTKEVKDESSSDSEELSEVEYEDEAEEEEEEEEDNDEEEDDDDEEDEDEEEDDDEKNAAENENLKREINQLQKTLQMYTERLTMLLEKKSQSARKLKKEKKAKSKSKSKVTQIKPSKITKSKTSKIKSTKSKDNIEKQHHQHQQRHQHQHSESKSSSKNRSPKKQATTTASKSKSKSKPKSTKRKNNNDDNSNEVIELNNIPIITIEQKKELSESINKLPPEKLGEVVRIIQESMPLETGQEEIELDIDSFDNSTLYRLYRIVVSNKSDVSSAKRRKIQKPKQQKSKSNAKQINRSIEEVSSSSSLSDSDSNSDDTENDSDTDQKANEIIYNEPKTKKSKKERKTERTSQKDVEMTSIKNSKSELLTTTNTTSTTTSPTTSTMAMNTSATLENTNIFEEPASLITETTTTNATDETLQKTTQATANSTSTTTTKNQTSNITTSINSSIINNTASVVATTAATSSALASTTTTATATATATTSAPVSTTATINNKNKPENTVAEAKIEDISQYIDNYVAAAKIDKKRQKVESNRDREHRHHDWRKRVTETHTWSEENLKVTPEMEEKRKKYIESLDKPIDNSMKWEHNKTLMQNFCKECDQFSNDNPIRIKQQIDKIKNVNLDSIPWTDSD